MKSYKIYKYTNLITGMSYVGQTHKTLKERAKPSMKGYHGCDKFWEAIEMYGTDCWRSETLWDGLTLDEANIYEQIEIRDNETLYPYGYNLDEGGGGVPNPSEKTRQKKSKSVSKTFAENPKIWREAQRKATEAAAEKNRGTPRSKETKQKISKSHIGLTHSEKSKQIMSEQRKGRPSPNKGKPSPLRGVPRPEETKAKLSQKLKGREFTAEHRANISAAQTGERNNNFGKPRSVETCQKIGEANASPYKSDAYTLFSALPESMSLREKRKVLCGKFADVPYSTIHGWTRQWQPEGISKLKDSREVFARNKAIAYDIFKSLFPTMTLREIHKILREKFSDYDKSTIYKWTKQWQSEIHTE